MSPLWRNRARWNGILCGVVIFIWSGIEDNDLTAVLVLGLWTSATTLWLWEVNQPKMRHLADVPAPIVALILGATMGLSTSLITALLMLFKNLRHNHIFPDYPFAMVRDVLGLAPFWALAGAIMALGLYFLLLTLKRDL